MGCVCCWFSSLLRGLFSWYSSFPLSTKTKTPNSHFDSGWKNHNVEATEIPIYLFIYLFIYSFICLGLVKVTDPRQQPSNRTQVTECLPAATRTMFRNGHIYHGQHRNKRGEVFHIMSLNGNKCLRNFFCYNMV